MALIDAIGLVVPVNNEAQRLSACISSIRAAVTHLQRVHPNIVVEVCFVLDRCSDDSAGIIDSMGYRWIRSDLAGVGAARATGVTWALHTLAGVRRDRVLIVCTDADSVVPREWLTHQRDLAGEGADIIIGAVRPNTDELDEARQRAWNITHRDGQSRGHVHGANLGVRASTYLSAGGFAPLHEHEDVDLVTRARATGARVRATQSHPVVTSARLEGRTAGGYAGYLRSELLPLAQRSPIEHSVA